MDLLFPDEKFSNLLAENSDQFLKSVFDKYYGELCKLSFKYVGRTETAEDIVQDVFINIWNKRYQLDNPGNIKPYLLKSVINSSINYIQSKYGRLQFSNGVDVLENHLEHSHYDDLTSNELQSLIKQAIEALPAKCRIIFLLSRFSCLSYREIAEKLGISVKTVETQISIALKRIQHFLKKGGYTLPLIFF
jgi:RNA polymerase sigma-70 factor (ECF subfamily)